MLGWLKNSASTRARKSVRPFRRELQFDSLEPRLLLAGDVTVAVDDGDLLITGDVAANAVLVRGTETPGQYVVSRADRSTTINGGTAPFTSADVTNFVIDMGAGNDRLNLANVKVSGSVSIDTGTNGGKDLVNVAYARIGGEFEANTGGGNDRVTLSALTVSGAAMIDAGAGNDRLYVSACKFDDTFDAHTGDGKDVVTVSAVQIVGASMIDTGDGADSGKDRVVISASRFEGSASVDLGDGNDRLIVTFSRFDSTFSADGGDGTDSLVSRFNRFLGDSPVWNNFERFPWL